MYQGKKQQFDWTFALGVTDGLSLAGAFLIVAAFGPIDKSGFFGERPPLHTCVAYYFLIIFMLRSFQLYRWKAFTRLVSTFWRLLGAIMFSLAGFAFFREFFGNQGLANYAPWLLVHAAVTLFVLITSRILLKYLLMDVFRVIPVERIAFIGLGPRMERILKVLARQMGVFQQTVGYFQTDADLPERSDHFKLLGSLERLEAELVSEKISLLIVEQGDLGSKEMRRVGEICARCFINLKIIPNIHEIWAATASVQTIGGIPVMGVYDLDYDKFHNRLLKRAMDIVLSIVGLVVSAPIIALMGILIKRESPGPIFFRQVRLGLHGKPFEIIKLRSMPLDAEQSTGAVWAVKDDPRRLRVGSFMRSTNFDELPQFWNVLKGDMSMVGPRPERPEFVTSFKHSIRYYNLRHSCKPGVTGWAAVNGLRGNTSLEDRLEYDLYYIENWSIFQDIKIILMTMLPPKNAY